MKHKWRNFLTIVGFGSIVSGCDIPWAQQATSPSSNSPQAQATSTTANSTNATILATNTSANVTDTAANSAAIQSSNQVPSTSPANTLVSQDSTTTSDANQLAGSATASQQTSHGWIDPTTLAPIKKWNVTNYKSIPTSPSVREEYSVPAGDVALTIDDGPTENTTKIIQVLNRYHAHATFFDVGVNVQNYPQAVKFAVASGDMVEDHSMSHPDFFTITPKQQEAQIDQDAHIISQLTGQPVWYFRPPYENFDETTEQILKHNGMTLALWNRDPRDWAATTSEQVVEAVLDGNPSGGVFDMHDTPLTLAALPKILRELEAKHLKIVLLPTPGQLQPGTQSNQSAVDSNATTHSTRSLTIGGENSTVGDTYSHS